MGNMSVSEVRDLLNILHDRLAYVLEDPSGSIYNRDMFQATFDSAIESLDWRGPGNDENR